MAADAIVVEYLNQGYPTARVERTLTPNADRTVDIAFRVQEGVQVIIDHILIVGNERTKAEIIERELVLKPGQPLADSDIIESRRRLNALGLFRRVQIADVRHPGQEARRDVLVTVEEALATTIGGGGGAEVGLRLERSAEGGLAEERIEFAPRGSLRSDGETCGARIGRSIFSRASAFARAEALRLHLIPRLLRIAVMDSMSTGFC
jgi:hypothetical protein